jgi:ribosome-associated protein
MKKQEKSRLDIVAEALDSKKALDIRVFDVSGESELWDYFVVATGTSYTHITTLYDNVEFELKEHGGVIYHMENESGSNWAVIDAGDILIHIFDRDTRIYYSLEKLWGEKEIRLKLHTTKELSRGKQEA